MSQKTNLNVTPYYDDFDAQDNYYRVLFKPGFPVQSRELTTLQSILQNQIKSFGSSIFKDGSVVIPGNVSYNSSYHSVKINPTHVGLSVGLYLKELVGKKIKGQTSQLSAVVQHVITSTESETDDYTLYVKYTTADSDFAITEFRDGETLILEENLVYGNTTISTGDTFATLIAADATAVASSVSIEQGIYFIRGHFVLVDSGTIVLDQYTNTPSYRVGLSITESLIDAQEDNNLYDNARGFSNYAAPGADRLKISATLSKKRLTDVDDKNFVEILRVSDGIVKKIQDTSNYSQIKEYIAKRTYEESGDYAVDPFRIEIDDSLNDRLNSDGVFFSNQRTEQGNTPSEDLLALKVSPGKAYVRGFDIEKTSTTIIDVDKPRDILEVKNTTVPFEMGNKLVVNNVEGTPYIGLDNNFKVDLHYRRRPVGSGATIGQARIYSFGVSDASYQNASTEFDLYLFDIQTYTILTLNNGATLAQVPVGSYVKGLSSGATGYVVEHAGTEFKLNQTSGTFIQDEEVSLNGDPTLTRSIQSLTVYGASDVRAVFQSYESVAGLTTSFIADAKLNLQTLPGFKVTDTLAIDSASGVATCAGRTFAGIKTETIISYQVAGESIPRYNRVESVSSDGLSLTLQNITGVSNVNLGGIGNGSFTFNVGVPKITNSDKAQLYASLNSKNISDVSLAGSDLTIVRQVSGKTTSATGTLSITLADTGISDAVFEPFDAERYSVVYEADGDIDPLTSEKFALDGTGTSINLAGLEAGVNVTVNVTLKKSNIKTKQKVYTRSQKTEVIRTVGSATTITSGLTQSSRFGLRVEDEIISLNTADVNDIVAIYESVDSGSVSLDRLTFSSGLNLNTESILGEKITGQTSGAVAQIVTRVSSTVIEFVYLNSNKFVIGETVKFEESGLSGSPTIVTKGSYINRTNQYILDNGQREQFYDYSRIIRKSTNVPTNKLLVIFNKYTVPTNDSGHVYTVNSYAQERYKNGIATLGSGVRASDIIDVRPRVTDFDASLGVPTNSPFAFDSRNFGAAGNNPSLVLSPNESSTVDYSFYLPRIDRLSLNKNGNIILTRGVSSTFPKAPSSVDDTMDLATIEYPAYLFNLDNIKVSLFDNKRYTMRDIRKLEDRIEAVEELTALNLLELNTKALQIKDSDGFDRFKSGFFVDTFRNTDIIDNKNLDSNVSVNTNTTELGSDVSINTLKGQASPELNTDITTADFSTDLQLLDNNIKKTGDLVTLNYSQVEWGNITQKFATKSQSVNPFGVQNYNGFVKLTPSSDTWAKTINTTGEVIVRTQGEWQESLLGNLINSSTPDNHLRSRNVQFEASGLKPATTYYSFFGGSGNVDVVPKLIKVSMTSGVFQTGETVIGLVNGEQVSSFRVAAANHKTGPYNTPTTTYAEDPYSPTLTLTTYSSSSTVLNIDTFSLADASDGRFYGYAPAGMILVGKTSSAQATVGTQTLNTDSVGDLIGCFFIRDPLSTPTPPSSFKVGSKSFKLTSSSTNSNVQNLSFTENTFFSSGVFDQTVYSESVSVRRPPASLPLSAIKSDPLSQTFRSDATGGFLTGIGLYFAGKDTKEKMFVEIRETDIGGVPTNKLIQDYARIEVSPSMVTTSTDGDTETKLMFKSPVYLQPNKQYSLCLISPSSANYKVYTAESTKATVKTQNYPNADQIIYSNQYTGGNLYKPQNGATSVPSLFEDLKFVCYKAQFTSSSGTLYINNPIISIGSTDFNEPDANIYKLQSNAIRSFPRKLNVGINTTYNTLFTPGSKVFEGGANGANALIEKTGGNIGGGNLGTDYNITNAGIGYSNGNFSNVSLYTITGNGSGATASSLGFGSGILNAVSIGNTGNGYAVGDVLGITTSEVGGKGTGARITVAVVPNTDTLYLTSVKGQEFTEGGTLSIEQGDGTLVSLAGTIVRGSNVVPSAIYEGNVFEVSHYNHGMHADNNKVTIGGIEPNTQVTTLTAAIVSTDTTVSVANTSLFANFEGSVVSASNPGYLIVNNEIISYTNVGSGTLTIGDRGVNDSTSLIHSVGDSVRKYELNGVSLTRINRSHDMPTTSGLVSRRDIDTYHLQFTRPVGKNSGDTLLNFASDVTAGGDNIRASQNIQFDTIIPYVNSVVPDGTSISSTLRTVSGTSVSGSEASFIDQGYETVSLNEPNVLSTPRMVCSRVNETDKLTSLPRNKSLTLGIRMNTNDNNISPVIDLSEAASFVFIRNRLNNPVSNYSADSSVNQLSGDPHSSAYISKQVNLEQPATSLKVILTAYRHSSSDFRVLYKLTRPDSSEIEQSYELFPGYNTTKNANGNLVTDTSKNDGTPDVYVKPSEDGEFLEYQFTADNLEEFTGFTIKIVMSGTNEAYAPKFHDLRAIALA